MSKLDQSVLKRALAGMATPVVVVTTRVDGVDWGFVANSFTSISMDPPLLGVWIARSTSAFEAFSRAESVAFNILAHDQEAVARQFATSGIDKFAGLALSDELPDVPAIAGTMVTLAGPVADRVVIGDHTLILVTPADASADGGSPLIYHQRDFRRLDRD